MLKIKQLISAALAAVCIFTALPSLAEDVQPSPQYSVSEAPEQSSSPRQVRLVTELTGTGSPELQSDPADRMELIRYFREETENFTNKIDVSSYDIRLADLGTDVQAIQAQAQAIYELLAYCSPRSYYLLADNGTYLYFNSGYEEREDGVYLTWIKPYYFIGSYDSSWNFDQSSITEQLRSEIAQRQETLDNEVKYVWFFLNDGMTDTEKLVAIQYALNLRYTYSYEDFQKPLAERRNNTALQLVENKKGMCLAFATLFNYIAMENGITETGFVSSKDAYGNDYHTWNIVKASTPYTDSVPHWYHIDVTWDNTINDGYGCTSMAYFFLSTEKTNESHNLYDEDGVQIVFSPSEEEIMKYTGEPTGTAFDDALWHDSATVLVPYAEKWYFILHQSGKDNPSVLMRFDPYANEEDSYIMRYDPAADDDGLYTELFRFSEEWQNGDNVLDHSYTGLGIVNGILYFNSPKKIHSYNILTGEIGTEITLPLADGYSVFSSFIYGNTLYYGISPDDNPTNQEVQFGGTHKLADVAVSDAKIYNNNLVLKISTYSASPDPKNIWLTVKDGDKYIVERRTVDSHSDHQSSWFTIPLQNSSVDDPPVIYVWDDNMRPYISSFCIDRTIYKYSSGGAVPVTEHDPL